MGKPANLIELAPLGFWQEHFPNRRDNVDHAAAVDMLISYSNKIGIFRPERIRGRGVWLEGKTVVVHAGDRLIVDGKDIDLGEYDSKFIYEQGSPLGYNTKKPLDNIEAAHLLDLSKMIRWEREVNAHLLAGWCVVAALCGALKWRPHIWITGPAGCGKTWVLREIIKRVLGSAALSVQGSTSEPGLRQALRRDARPVIFDEAEGEDRNAQERMQGVFTLMRSSSAEDGGDIIKGSTHGSADAYQIRSCFGYASIGMLLNQQSDRSRVSILTMRPQDAESDSGNHFEKLIVKHTAVMTDEYIQRLQARGIKLLPVILENARIFSAAASAHLGQKRAGDQLGALLAGAYSLVSDTVIELDKAIEWVKQKDWSIEEELQDTKDEHMLFQHILGHQVSAEGEFSKFERNVGELIQVILGKTAMGDNHVTSYSADKSLMRLGIKVDVTKGKENATIFISNTAPAIKRLLRETSWAKNHSNILSRLPGAEKVKTQRFGDGLTSRAVAIPASYFYE